MRQKHKVLSIFTGSGRKPGACEIYRITMPYWYLNQCSRDWCGGWAFFEDLWNQGLKHGELAWARLIKEYDAFVFPRLYVETIEALHNIQEVFDLIKRFKKKVVYETDDDYTNQHREVVQGDAISIAKLADHITVSTPYLSQLMAGATGLPATVLPNCIDPLVWNGKREGTWLGPEDNLIIGLSGSPTHENDWRVLETVLPDLLERYGSKIHLLVMGFHPEYLKGLPNTTYEPARPYESYAQIIKRCDIILAPVNDDGFNLSKSPLKVLEGMSASRPPGVGAACIASDHPIYRLAISHEKNGLLTPHTPAGWRESIERLIVDAPLRQRLSREGHQWLWQHHNIQRTWVKWEKAYETIRKG